MLEYSVAIRTLGTSPATLREELISLHNQSIPPKEIIIYIAEGFDRPSFTIGKERYVFVKKGMVAQRALRYEEISSELILLLDDDIAFKPTAIESVITLMNLHKADCIAFDTFRNHTMSFPQKLKAAITGFVFPRLDKKWAFKLHSNDSFSYINYPGNECYLSMSAAGPAAMWRKQSFLNIHIEDELWLDKLGFAYGDDGLQFYKLHINGGKLMVTFNSDVINLDAKTSSSSYHSSHKRFYIMAMASVIKWHRMHISPTSNRCTALLKTLSFAFKISWQILLLLSYSIISFKLRPTRSFISGMADAIRFLQSDDYLKLPPYKLDIS